MVSMALLTLPVMAPVVGSALGVSSAYVGVYVALVYAGAMLASLSAGTAVARFGAIRVSQVGLMLCALGLALCAVNSVPVIALGAVFIGMGYGPVTPASSHLLALSTPAHRMSLVFSLKQTGVPLGGVLAGVVIPGVLLVTGWQSALLLVALLCVLCAVMSQPLRAELDADRNPKSPLMLGSLAQPIRLVLRHRGLTTLAMCSFVFSATQLSLVTYLVTYLYDSLAYGLIAAGFALSVSQVAGMGGRVFWGYVADRFLGARLMLAALGGLMALCCVATALFDAAMPRALVLTILAVFGASAIGWNGVYLAEVARQAPKGQASLATGGTLAVTFLGVVLGPPVFGALSGLFGSYRAGYAALAVPALLCCVLLVRQKHSLSPRQG
ncbi:MAG: MFS transporter [Gammaproteobacteria bacterium]|nr:MFS transporter [Gammaproteobacteria bacterium]MBU0787077.1 MFS transporter [Gammaproteobacteria bacterium]MBU0816328.1 MFS transporter [Gammaproteobacteria bacterium]MBU1787965.1 MFS transporter [Gammaproteobacteria bacterium]